MQDTLLLAFKAIHTFVKDLSSEFGEELHALQLYARLVEQTTLAHEKAIQKHVRIFTEFCEANAEALAAADATLLVSTRISFTERVFVDVGEVLARADAETRTTVWKHLLTIAALCAPEHGFKKALVSLTTPTAPRRPTQSGGEQSPTQSGGEQSPTQSGGEQSPTQSGGELNFLTGLISKMESTIGPVGPDTNPMASLGAIMQSGVFTELVESISAGVSDGGLDLAKMMEMVQQLMAPPK